MKTMKKIGALVLAVVMAMALAVPAMAIGETPASAYDPTVSVTALQSGDVAHFYKIVEWVGSAEGNYKGWKAVSPYEFTPDLETVLSGKAAVEADPTATPPVEAQAAIPAGITATLAKALAAKAAGDGFAVPANGDGVAELNVANGEGKGAGIYMVLVSPANPDIAYNPVFVSSDYNLKADDNTNTWAMSEIASYLAPDSAAKKSTTTLDKTASTQESAPDDIKWVTTAIGDTVHFTVKTTIPGFGNAFKDPFFKVTDKLHDLTLVSGSVKIKSPTEAAASGAATITEGTDNYSILFAENYLKTVTTPTEVTIEYDAIVSSTASLNVNREKNEVSTEFSNDPTNSSSHSFKKDTTQHYTFTIGADVIAGGAEAQGKKGSEIVKVGRDADGNPIKTTTQTSTIDSTKTWEGPQEGAHFKLYRDANCTTEYIPKNANGTDGNALDIKSGADGRMQIAGLDAGEYWLKEDSCPAGFVMDTHVAHIVISTVETPKTVTEYTTDGTTWISAEAYAALSADAKKAYTECTYETTTLDSYTITIDGVKTAEYHFNNQGNEAVIDWTETPPVELPHQFTNNQGLELPSTGGIGTKIFYTMGAVLVVGAGVVLVSRKRAGE